MTKEQAIENLKDILSEATSNENSVCYVTGEDKETLEIAIKALEQQPCNDCVSRQAVDQNIYDYAESNGLSYANLKNAILDVPSVTPTHGTCKDCKKYRNSLEHCTQWVMHTNDNFYCADFER